MSEVSQLAQRARTAARALSIASTQQRNDALGAMADALVSRRAEIIAANAEDMAAARAKGTQIGLLDRLELNEARIAAIAEAIRDVAARPHRPSRSVAPRR